MTYKEDTKVSKLVINELTKEQYKQALESGEISESELYLVSGEEYNKEEVDRLLANKQNKLIPGPNIVIDEDTNTISSTGGGDTSLCVHIDGHEIVTGVKEFTGGSGGSSTDGSLKTLNALVVGNETQTNYTGIYNHRKCSGDSNVINTAGFLVNSDGSAKFTHKRGTTTEISTSDDSYITFNSNKFVYSNSGDVSDEKDILHTGNAYNKTDVDNIMINKQDIISDLSTIRTNAQTGADLAPQVANNTQRIEDLTTSRIPDVIYRGTPKITGGQITNFSTVNYLLFPFEDISRGLPFDIYFSFTTDSDVTTQQNIIDSNFGIALAIQNGKGVMALSSNGINWDIGSATGTVTLLPNTTYYVKYSWTGTEYKTYISTNTTFDTTDMVLPSTLSPFKTTIYIGGCDQQATTHTPHPFKGIINFTKSRVDVNGITVWEGMADVGVASRANVSLTNLDEVGEKRFADKQDVITDLETIRDGASKGTTTYTTIQSYGDIVSHNAIEFALKSEISGLAKDSDVVHKANAENISGVKTFTGGSGGNNVGIKVSNGMAIGGTTQTAYAQYATIRNVNNLVNTGSYYIDGNGSVLFRHKTGTATAEGSSNDAMFTINPTMGIKAGWSGTAGKGITDADLNDVLIDTVQYSKLNTEAKDVLGAINELNNKPSGAKVTFRKWGV